VNAALATVVHLSGTETITGAKQFSVSPVLPTPSQSGQAVNKAYEPPRCRHVQLEYRKGCEQIEVKQAR